MRNQAHLGTILQRRVAVVLWDVLSWITAGFVAIQLRFSNSMDTLYAAHSFTYVWTSIAVLVMVGLATQLYLGRYPVGSYDETVLLVIVVMLTAVLSGTLELFLPRLPRSLIVITPALALASMASARLIYRLSRERKLSLRQRGEPVLVYGAGMLGNQLTRLMRVEQAGTFDVVGLLDDDVLKQNLHLNGAAVVGYGSDLAEIVHQTGATTVILSIATPPPSFIAELQHRCDELKVRLLVPPPIGQMVSGSADLSQLHEVDVNDLLGRPPVSTDLASIAEYLTGKVIMVTGAGGSIGSELARQVHKFSPKELVYLDRDESGLHSTQLSIYGTGLLDTPDVVLCDIRDKEALEKIFEYHRPDVVFHAAALKHLPMLEQYPEEGWKTNVLGTLNVLECAAKYGVHKFVNISTDKAADPISVLGFTKRFAERLTAWFAASQNGTFLSVRFGNVLGSRGSVLHTFKAQIEAGGPLTITHPDVERYFMTIPEACQLVIQAGAIGEDGDVMVLDMGKPVRIIDVANRLIALSKKDIEIMVTGLRPGEKLTETLFSGEENSLLSAHSMISKVRVTPLDPNEVRDTNESVNSLRYRSSASY